MSSGTTPAVNGVYVEKDGNNYYELVKDENGLYKRKTYDRY